MKLKVLNIIFFIFFLNLFNPLFNSIIRSYGYFGFLSLFRDLGIITLFIIFFATKKIVKNDLYVLLLFGIFTLIYILQSIHHGDLSIGISFIRVYLLPLLFLFICTKIFELYTFSSSHIIGIININIIANIVSLFIVLLFYVDMNKVLELYTLKGISGGWLLVGAIYRAGWPLGGPNQLGLFTASFFILYYLMISEKRQEILTKKKFYFAFLLNTIVLLLTFSRSSWIFLCLFLVIYVFLYKKRIRLSVLLSVFFLAIFGGFIIVVSYREAVEIWLQSIFNFTDLSIQGHLASFKQALIDIKEYFFWGYPKGTVGPRAHIFYGKLHHVENAFLLSLMDFGIFAFIVYYLTVFYLLSKIIKTYEQLIYLISLLFPFFLLPYSQDIETMINISFFILFIGSLFKNLSKYKKYSYSIIK